MIVRIPGPGEPAAFGPPVATPAAEPPADLPDGTQHAMRRMQARDDAVFIATSLARLATRHREAARVAEEAVLGSLGDHEAAARHIDGFARRIDEGFGAEVERIVREAQSLSGPRPSDAALELLRRRAAALRRNALARNAIVEDALRRAAQRRSLEEGIDGLAAAVQVEPEGFDQAIERLADLTGAAAALVGREQAATLDLESRARLAATAARALIARDPPAALAAVRDGAWDEHLDTTAKARLVDDAEALSQAAARDDALRRRRETDDETRRGASRALAFLGDFRRRLAAGEAGFGEIAAARADGTIAPARADALAAELERSLAARADEDATVARVAATLRDGGTLDPADPRDREAAETFFARVIAPQAEAMPPAERIAFLERLPETLGLAPEAAVCPLGGMVLAGAPEQRVAAAGAIVQLLDRDPQARHCLPPPVLSLAEALAGLAPLRLPPEAAVGLAAQGWHDMLYRPDPNDSGPRARLMPATGEGAEPVLLSSEDTPGAEPFGETEFAQLAGLQSSLESAGKPSLARLLGKILDYLRRGRPVKPPRDDERPGPAMPRPKLPVPRVGPEGNEEPRDQRPPEPGHNGPPTEEGRSGVRDVELRPGVTIRGNPSSESWKRFTAALDRLTGRSREAAEGLVNGGELTTSKGAGEELSNVTRRGTLQDSLREFDKAVERAGGIAADVEITIGEKGTRRTYEAEDGTIFQHRTESATGPTTVDIRIEKPVTRDGSRQRPDQVKIRFEPPEEPEDAGAAETGPKHD